MNLTLTKKRIINLSLVSALTLLVACGGGGGGSSVVETNSSTLSGVAAVGYPIINGSIKVVCTGGGSLNTTTNSTGAWQVIISGQTLPCAVAVSGGTINNLANTLSYHSIATSFGTVNVTPLTNLMLANLVGTVTPTTWFTSLAPATLASITSTLVDVAISNQCSALSGLSPLCANNPVTTVFTATSNNIMDNMLSALQMAMMNTGVTYASLLNQAFTAGYSTPVAGFNTALTTAYTNLAGTPGGNGTLTVASAPANVGGTFDAKFITVTGKADNGIVWGEGIIGIDGTAGELLIATFDSTTNVAKTVIFQRVESLTKVVLWGCSGPAPCSGITLNRSAGNVTFVNVALVPFNGNSVSTITLNGKLTFTPF